MSATLSPSTNAIGSDTCNFAVNLLKSEKELLAKKACREGKSLGQFIRELIHDGLVVNDRDLAERYERQRVRRWSNAACLCLVGSAVIWQVLIGELDARRAPRPTTTRSIRRQEWN